jgi:hypothetical protein
MRRRGTKAAARHQFTESDSKNRHSSEDCQNNKERPREITLTAPLS